jgi:HD-GYP domain-containing protein (c-di-GMP phosphodiesterase class II)
MQSHTWQGVLAIFAMPTGSERPWRAMTTAYEHHMRIDMSGYPRPLRSRDLMLFTKIISVADGFDAATSRRVYQNAPWSPADVLQGMRDDPRHGVDPVVVKAFINMMGVYPVGTLVVLDSSALAIVMAANPDPTALSRPLVRLITDARGNRLLDSHTYDLTSRDASGQFERTIIRTEDAKRYGINLRDYFS